MEDRKRPPILGIIWFTVIAGAIPAWSLYIDLKGLLIQGKVYAKRESINILSGDWSRSLSVTAAYQPAGEWTPSYEHAEVDAATFDRLRVGSPVTVRYLPSRALRQFPFISSARIENYSILWLSMDRYASLRRFFYWALGCAALALVWRKAHLNMAGWLLIPWVGFGFFHAFMPAAEPQPSSPVRSARATVNRVTEITQILETDESPGMDLSQPYQIVELQFVPAGRAEPVLAVDKIDSGSVQGIMKGHAVEIEYEEANPRIVRIENVPRTFPQKVFQSLLLYAGAWTLGLLLLAAIWQFFRTQGRRVMTGLGAVVEDARARRKDPSAK